MAGGGVCRVAGEIFSCFMRFSSCLGTSRMTSAPMSASLIFSLSLYVSRSCSGTCVMVVIADDSIVDFTCGGGGGTVVVEELVLKPFHEDTFGRRNGDPLLSSFSRLSPSPIPLPH
uniref:Uncharacterized protein n=1 Tax=Chromera velia CCMP2878 TaxID=1169474 RepID=A0A0G4GW90_9ALVE|eukprot:Cvel_23652.t1-p1 / transcript=Cvel_23652.t1 / gene=Cvel_23652 / organism=Chromera_velia_CCMP2878 / gene_product=hypothetical protein / transcript_product=hypothetical protein / location=Cvel_scaffold2462:6561-6905(+) / protein_length=115 / sequence_SO=supercontig / SO=protein_coding / is_pseudo=false